MNTAPPAIRSHRVWFMICALSLFTCNAQAKRRPQPAVVPLAPNQAALVNQAVLREKVTLKQLQKRIPLVQTYIQIMKPDPRMASVPASDVYMLSRVDFARGFGVEGYRQQTRDTGLVDGSKHALSAISNLLRLNASFAPAGFMQMMFIDAADFDRQHYNFEFVRTEFLGSVKTQVFNVTPWAKNEPGRFNGRVWIEDQEGNVVRFNGIVSGNEVRERPRYLHFDSWRTNPQPGLWLPAATYVEETHGKKGDDALDLRAQTTFWGYSLKLPTRESEHASVQIDDVTDTSDAAQDVSPLQATREWVAQAQDNVLDRLVQAGVVAPPSDFDKVMETVTNNLIIGNKLEMPDAVHCRVLLTAPLESLAVGNTILLSRGLIDVLPYEEDLAAALAFQLAHITLGHYIDTRYAFNDRLLFPDQAAFQRITMNHSERDDAVAAKKAIELLRNSVYRDHLANAGLFFKQLQARSKELKALTTPRLGDSLLNAQGVPWMAELSANAPPLDPDKLDQVAALPLGSHLKINSWDDKVSQLNAKSVPLLNARDKMPFQLTPIFFRLTRYTEPASAAVSATTAPPPPLANP
jgi:hypothetical protein